MTKAKQGKDKHGKTRKPFDALACKAMYEAGTHKIRDLAKLTGYCYGTVRRRLLEVGTVLDRPGGNRRKRKVEAPKMPQGTEALTVRQEDAG